MGLDTHVLVVGIVLSRQQASTNPFCKQIFDHQLHNRYIPRAIEVRKFGISAALVIWINGRKFRKHTANPKFRAVE